MISLLLLGFLIGMRHALEADHVAAVASMITGNQTLRGTIRQGVAWGAGHTITLFLFGSIVIMMDSVMPKNLAQGLELVVGIMLIFLGGSVIHRVIRDRVHFHTHCHTTGDTHFHAHSHRGEASHELSPHKHRHEKQFPFRALIVGLVHGMAGSAMLILITLETVKSLWIGLMYMALFGIGSMLGMAFLSFAIAIPLRESARRLTWFHNIFEAAIGLITIGIGLNILSS